MSVNIIFLVDLVLFFSPAVLILGCLRGTFALFERLAQAVNN